VPLFSRLDRLEAAIVASGVLLLVPGARAVWAWPWLLAVPGWFFARRVLGIRDGLALVTWSLVSSIAFSSLVCLPLTIVVGAPRPWIVFASIGVFALACSLTRPGAARLPSVPWPPLPASVLVACFAVFRAVVAIVASKETPSGPDGWYLTAVVRELAHGYPPSNPIAAATILKQPWGYWLLYALAHVASGLSLSVTLEIASLVIGVTFLLVLYALVTTASGDRNAGGFAIGLALGAAELLWVEEWVHPTTERLTWDLLGVGTFPVNLVHAYYDLPALILAVAVLYFLLCERVALAGAFLAIAPFFHPVHAAVLYLSLGLAFTFELGRRRLSRVNAWLLAAPVPFLVLYVLLYARGLPPHMPFVPRLAEVSVQLVRYVRWAGLFVPVAIAGALRRDVRLRSALVMLFATTSALSIFTFAANYHWTADLLSVSMYALGGLALGRAVSRYGRLGALLGVAVVVIAIAAASYPAFLTPATDRRTADERAAGRFIAESTPPRAIVAVDHRSMASIGTVLSLGGRRVFLGPTYQLANTTTRAELEGAVSANLAILREPCEARRRGVDDVLLENRPDSKAELAAWRAAGAAAFANGTLTVFSTATIQGCP
jgi:hypothetical protein